MGSLEVFSDSAAGALPAIWAKLPQSLVLEGEKKGWRKITQRSKCFLLKKEPKQRKHKKRTSEKTNGLRLVPPLGKLKLLISVVASF